MTFTGRYRLLPAVTARLRRFGRAPRALAERHHGGMQRKGEDTFSMKRRRMTYVAKIKRDDERPSPTLSALV